MELVLAVLAASLLGSPHCAAMCGGFVCFYAGSAAEGSREVRGHVAYHLGRLVSYATLGAVAGALGARIDDVGRLAGVQRGAAIVAGTLMVAWGLGRIAAPLGVRLPSLGTSVSHQRRMGGLLRRLAARPLAVRAGALGLVTTLLPCGWLWAFVVTASGTARPLAGALVMATFWVGTLPMLALVGVAAQRIAGPFRRRLPLVSAVVLVALGLLSIAGKMQMGVAPTHAAHHGMAATPLATFGTRPHDRR